MKTLNKGVLVVFEGIDGSGKSTLAHLLTKKLINDGFEIVLTKEPGGSMLGKDIRLLLEKQTYPIDPKAEFLLFAADRAQHITDIVKPALQKNALVISDRMNDSSVIYQGYGRKLSIPTIKEINTWTMNGIKADITFFVDIDATTAQKRRVARGKAVSFDTQSEQFFQQLIDGYRAEFKPRSDVISLGGTMTIEHLVETSYTYVISWLQKNNYFSPKK